MKTEDRKIYRCEYCNKYGLSKGGMTRHEKICFKNPTNFRQCFECPYLEKKETTIDYNYPSSEYENQGDRKVSLFYCSKKDSYLWTPQNKIRGNEIESGESNMYMPTQCEDYDNYFKELLK